MWDTRTVPVLHIFILAFGIEKKKKILYNYRLDDINACFYECKNVGKSLVLR